MNRSKAREVVKKAVRRALDAFYDHIESDEERYIPDGLNYYDDDELIDIVEQGELEPVTDIPEGISSFASRFNIFFLDDSNGPVYISPSTILIGPRRWYTTPGGLHGSLIHELSHAAILEKANDYEQEEVAVEISTIYIKAVLGLPLEITITIAYLTGYIDQIDYEDKDVEDIVWSNFELGIRTGNWILSQ